VPRTFFILFTRILIISIVIISLAHSGIAQTFYQITTTNGSQIIGNNTITVTHSTTATYGSNCGFGPYFIGGGYFIFSFSQPVDAIKISMDYINDDDTVKLLFNGIHYTVASSNLSYPANTCLSPPMSAIIMNGNIVGIPYTSNAVEFEAQPNYSIYNVKVLESVIASGFGFSFYIVNHCHGSVEIGSNQDTLCSHDTLHLFTNDTGVSNTATYAWSGPNFFYANSQSPIVDTLNSLSSGTYTVIVSDTGSCSYSSSKTIVVYNNPSFVANTNTPLCVGDTLHLIANSSTNAIAYQWHSPNNIIYSTPNVVLANISQADSGKYIITGALNNCSVSDTLLVAVNALPAIPTASSNSPICAGDTLLLNATCTSSSVSYAWTGPNSFNSSTQDQNIANASVSLSGTYMVKVTNGNGCANSSSVSMVVNARPANLSITSSSACIGSALNISAHSTSSGVNYSWSGPNNFSSTAQNVTVFNITFADSGNYFLTATLNGCNLYDTVNIAVFPTPAKPLASNNSPLCSGDTLKLQATDTTNSIHYYWQGPNLFTDTLQDPVIMNVQAFDSGKYIAWAVYNGCYSSADTTNVVIHQTVTPSVNLSSVPATILPGYADTFIANVTNGGTLTTYQWYFLGSPVPGATDSSYITSLDYSLPLCVVIHSNAWCAIPDTATACIELTTSIGNVVGKNGINIYPNPASSILYIETSEIVSVSILSMEGRVLIYKQEANNIDISSLSNGIYIIQVFAQNGLLLKTDKLAKE